MVGYVTTARNSIITAAPALGDMIVEDPDPAVSSYRLVKTANGDLALRTRIDFAANGPGSDNRQSVGRAINLIKTQQRSPGFGARATRLFFSPDVATLGATYDLLPGSGVVSGQGVAFAAQDRLADTLARRIGARDPLCPARYRHDALRLSGSSGLARIGNDYRRRAILPCVTLALPGGTTALATLDDERTGRQTKAPCGSMPSPKNARTANPRPWLFRA